LQLAIRLGDDLELLDACIHACHPNVLDDHQEESSRDEEAGRVPVELNEPRLSVLHAAC
jgi:hypothetical protein